MKNRNSGKLTPKLLALAVSACFCAPAWAAAPAPNTLPVNPVIQNGSAVISNPTANSLLVVNTPGTIINWNSFSIGSAASVYFQQQSALSSVLNKVGLGAPASQIYGMLGSNGKVFLINPNGIVFGPGSVINVAGLVASTLNLSNQDFLAGRLNFTDGLVAGSLSNQGSITTPAGGQVYLIAPSVENHGIITSPQGDVILAAGQSVHLYNPETPGVKVQLTAPDNNAVNVGSIIANGGKIGLYGANLTQKGTLNADSATVNEQGEIILKATKSALVESGSLTTANGPTGGKVTIQSETGDTLVSGTVTAKGTESKGGTAQVLGNRVALLDGAQVDVSGRYGGGTALVGGDYQGKNADIQNAQQTHVAPNASIKADALDNGNGGKVIAWADDVTRAYGTISARGGAQGGDGGFVEVSGKQFLNFQARVDASSPKGKSGTLLLDPTDITIVNALTLPATESSGANPVVFQETPAEDNESQILASTLNTLLDAGTSVTINTSGGGAGPGGGDITVNAAFGISSGQGGACTPCPTLTLNADSDIILNQGISSAGAALGVNMTAGNQIQVNAGLLSNNGFINLTGNNITFAAGGNVNAGSNTVTLVSNGSGALTSIPVGASVTAANISIKTDQFDLVGTLAGTTKTKIFTNTDGRVTWIGSGVDATKLAIDNTELSKITTPTLQIGDSSQTGVVVVTSAITSPATNLLLESGASGAAIASSGVGAIITATNLSVKAPNGYVDLEVANNAMSGNFAAETSGGVLFKNNGNLNVGTVDSMNGIKTTAASTVRLTTTSGSINVSDTAAANDIDSFGSVELFSATTITDAPGAVIKAGTFLDVQAVNGITLDSTHNVSTLYASNSTSGGITFKNSGGTLAINTVTQVGGSPVVIENTGTIALGSIDGGGGVVTIRAHSGNIFDNNAAADNIINTFRVDLNDGSTTTPGYVGTAADPIEVYNAAADVKLLSFSEAAPTNGIFVDKTAGPGVLDLQGISGSGDVRLRSNTGITNSAGLVTTGNGNVTLETTGAGSISITAPINKAGTGTLTLQTAAGVGNDISINSNIIGNTGNVVLNAGDDIFVISGTISGVNLTATAANSLLGNPGVFSFSGTTSLAASSSQDISLNNASNNFGGAVSISSANNVTLQDVDAIDLGASTVSGNLAITAGGNITDSGNLVVSGTTSLSVGGNSIILNSAGNDFVGAVNASAFNFTLVDINSIDLAASTITNNITLTAGNGITQSGALTNAGGGITTLASGAGAVNLNNASNVFGNPVSISNGTNVTLYGNAAGMTLNAMNHSGTLTVNSAGVIVGSQVIGGASASYTAVGGISLTGVGSTTPAVALNNSGGGAITYNANAASLTINAANTAAGTISISNTGGTLNFTSVATGSGDITLSSLGDMSLGSATTTGTVSATTTGAGSGISDGNGAASNISAATINLNADGGGIGAGDAIEVSASTLINATNLTSGDILLTSPGAMPLGAIQTPGIVTVTADSITSTGSIASATLNATATNGISLTGTNSASTVNINNTSANPVTYYANTATLNVGLTNAGGHVTVANNGNINLTGVSTANGVTLTATGGNITDSGAVSITGTSTLSANDIILDAANNFGGTVSVSTGTNVTLNDIGAIDLGASGSLSSLTVTSAGAITQGGALIVTGNSSFSAGGNPITLTAANNFGGAVSASNTGANAIQLTDTNAIILGAISTGNNLTVNAVGISQDASGISVGGTTTLNGGAGSISLNTASNDFVGAVSATTTLGLNLADASDLDLGTTTVGNNLILSAVGNISDSATLTITGTTTASAANVILDSAANDFTGAVTVTGASAVTLQDVNALSINQISASGAVNLSAGGVLTIGGSGISANTAALYTTGGVANHIVFNAPVTTTLGLIISNPTGGDWQINAAVNAGTVTAQTGVNIDASGGGTISSAGTVSLDTGGDNIILTTPGNSIGTLAIPSANNVTIDNASAMVVGISSIAGNLSLTSAGAITNSGALTVAGTTTINAGANDVTLTNAGNQFTGAVSVTGNNVSLTDTNTIDLGAATIAGSLIVNAGGAITDSAAISVGGTTSLNAGANLITLNNPNDFVGAVSVVSGSNVTLMDANALILGSLAHTGTLSATAMAGDITGSGIIGGTSATYSATTGINLTGANTTPSVTLSTTTGNIQYSASAAALTVPSATTTAGGGITIFNSGGTMSLTSASTGSGAVTLTSAGNLTLGTASSSGLVGINSTGGQILDGNAGTNNISAGTVSLNASSGIASAGDPLDVTATTSISASTTTGDIYLASPGNMPIASLSATAGTVSLNATGTIVDTDGAATNIFATTASLTAGTGIGTLADPIETQLSNLGATTATGGIYISNTGILSVTGLSAVAGEVSVQNTGAMSIDGNVTAGSNIMLDTFNSGGTDDITINANITSSSGFISLTGEDGLTQNAGTTVSITGGSGGISYTANIGNVFIDPTANVTNNGTGNIDLVATTGTVDNQGTVTTPGGGTFNPPVSGGAPASSGTTEPLPEENQIIEEALSTITSATNETSGDTTGDTANSVGLNSSSLVASTDESGSTSTSDGSASGTGTTSSSSGETDSGEKKDDKKTAQSDDKTNKPEKKDDKPKKPQQCA